MTDVMKGHANRGAGIWITIVGSILILAGLWGTCAWQKWGSDRETVRDPTELMVYLAFSTVATAIIVPGVWLQIRKVRALTMHGVTTLGRVEKISMLTKHGMSPTTIVYTVGDREYRVRRDLARNRVEVGGTIPILYDPRNPKRFSILL